MKDCTQHEKLARHTIERYLDGCEATLNSYEMSIDILSLLNDVGLTVRKRDLDKDLKALAAAGHEGEVKSMTAKPDRQGGDGLRYQLTQTDMDRLHGAAHGGAMQGGDSAYDGCLKVEGILAEIAGRTRDPAEGAETYGEALAKLNNRFAFQPHSVATPKPAPDAMQEALTAAWLHGHCRARGFTFAETDIPGCKGSALWHQALQEVAALSAPVPSTDGAPIKILPCDVHLPPVTYIGKGCKVETLMTAIRNRENWPHDLTIFRFPSATGAAEPVAFDPSNHHNALKCPYCNPQGLSFATPPVREDREAIARAIFKSRLKVGDQTADVYFARRTSHPHAIDDSTMAVDAAFRDADALIAAGLVIPVQPGAGEREAELASEILAIRKEMRGFDYAGCERHLAQALLLKFAISRRPPQSSREE